MLLHMPDRKVSADHLRRDAYLYVRQSTLRQVAENVESTKRQYALRDRAIAAGWPAERIHTIDNDLGKSGASTAARDGFQHLVSEVALGKAGIVMGLEVSRLARNSADWHRLIELCSLSSTLILDEDGIYDPANFNDRLLLGLKGTMSEAELHIIRARLRGGILNKARRGELEIRPPVGLVYRPDGKIALDPNIEVQNAIRLLFETFDRTASATKTARFLREQGLQFPSRLQSGPNKGELVWAVPQHARVLQVLHNPRYAGAFVFGRMRSRRRADGGTDIIKLPREEWQFVIKETHPGYIDWERFEANQQRLTDNGRAFRSDRRSGPPREGPALLQGRVLCGVCGERMKVEYHQLRGDPCGCPNYVCNEDVVRRGGKVCQTVRGNVVDAAISALLVELVTPMNLDVTLAVQRELETRVAEIDAARRQHVDRTRYEAELARRRYMSVDPDNRLVASSLEAEWNEKLRAHSDAAAEYDRRAQEQAATLDEEARRHIRELAEQFPRVWNDPRVPSAERKRILRLLVEDVTLLKGQTTITANVRLSGGATRTLVLPRPLSIADIRKFPPDVVAEVDRLLDHHRDHEIAEILNNRGLRTGEGKLFKRTTIASLRVGYNLSSHHDRLRQGGLLTTQELAERLQVTDSTIRYWERQGLIKNCYPNSRVSALWELPAGYTITKGRPGCRGSARLVPIPSNQTNEV
jgi:DNA invertase Pin-like site-specific DNA recombinase